LAAHPVVGVKALADLMICRRRDVEDAMIG
jgi:hypothetical protein